MYLTISNRVESENEYFRIKAGQYDRLTESNAAIIKTEKSNTETWSTYILEW